MVGSKSVFTQQLLSESLAFFHLATHIFPLHTVFPDSTMRASQTSDSKNIQARTVEQHNASAKVGKKQVHHRVPR